MKKLVRPILLVSILILTLTSNLLAMSTGAQRGTIRGSVFLDVNGDGRCINSGVAGETAVPFIDLDFATVDGGQRASLYSGSNGTYGLPSVAQGSWVVTAVPNPALWQVTSTNPQFVSLTVADGLVQLNVDFCVQPTPGVSLTAALQGTAPEGTMPDALAVETAPPSNSTISEQLLTTPPEAHPAENLADRADEEIVPMSEETWLTYLNYFRSMGDLEPLQNSAALTNGSQLHSRYMVLNDDPISHNESHSNPLFTPEGNQAAKNGNIFATTQIEADYRWAINFWVSAPFHLVNILDPTLATVGYGEYHAQNGTFKMAAVLDVLSEKGNSEATVSYPLYFPAPDSSTWIVRESLYEWPDPLTSCPGYSRPTGSTVVLQLGDGSGTPRVTSYALSVNGQVVPSCLITEANYTNPDPFAQRTGRKVLGDQDAIVIIPRSPMLANSTYTVHIVANGQSYDWSFSTTNSPPSN
ncbi:MAG: CAP domain-containing protein [Ardenticatenaceae bacterium]|nr:CAP domain-containing protein [Anaerolineales bacterium]MCB8939093.1 CAP domain-containing protein [Ardenticatenaceae bacterium]MCB8974850.1 CAP domain-containing protein [Ardenticatenaceae bacterium]